MIIAPRFEGDTHKRVMVIQHDVYRDILWQLYGKAREKYLQAERTLGLKTVPGILIKPQLSYDHRVMQHAHDLIAARFRMLFADRLHPELPFEGQEDDRKRIEKLWKEYWTREVDRLTDIPELTLAIANAIAFENTEVGYEAEEQMHKIIIQEYEGIIT